MAEQACANEDMTNPGLLEAGVSSTPMCSR
ncbi:hypothetical protein STSP_20290 [Streptomyces jeddahensis]|uniref:Uncharacterized protein n=1 Tax=Streptomyces jeddahensis TaxID=1716141 RepID=A0A177HWJ2_9ACTN|nr:hypothetical protein STSP_20290 [Streptomyces jeddahensis]